VERGGSSAGSESRGMCSYSSGGSRDACRSELESESTDDVGLGRLALDGRAEISSAVPALPLWLSSVA
jgi:hypothetical protein